MCDIATYELYYQNQAEQPKLFKFWLSPAGDEVCGIVTIVTFCLSYFMFEDLFSTGLHAKQFVKQSYENTHYALGKSRIVPCLSSSKLLKANRYDIYEFCARVRLLGQ